MPKLVSQNGGIANLAVDLVRTEGFKTYIVDGDFIVKDANTGVVILEDYLKSLCAATGERYDPNQGEIEALAYCLGVAATSVAVKKEGAK